MQNVKELIMSLNKVMLIGNVGKDPEVRYLESNPQNPATNAKVASFPLATSERYRDRNGELKENTEWHNIVVWRGNADVVERFVRKGSQLYIEGRLRTRQWTDQTGNKRYTTEVIADTLQLLGKRLEGDQPAQAQPQPQAQAPVSGYAGPGYGAPASAPVAVSVAPAPVAAAPVAAQPQVSQDYQGPLPAAEPSDDLPF